MTKNEIYAQHGIEYDTKSSKLYHPVLGWISRPLINGNNKIGKGVWHFSTLPGTETFTFYVGVARYEIKGTCACDCVGCYAKTGRYVFQNVINALGVRTWLAVNDPAWLENAIAAQIKADHIETVRIHAAGDFVSLEYLEMWIRMVERFPAVTYWTYTKVAAYEAAFDPYENANIVKSVVKGYGFNFGHCDYIIRLYNILKAAGKTVHVCRCGVDSDQHCTTCLSLIHI